MSTPTTKVSVVTGGAGGMGLAVARVLGQDSTVVISDLGAERLETGRRELKDAGIDCAAVVCDVTDPDSVGRLVDGAQEFGTVTSVVHTAGVSPSMGSAETILRINAVGTVLVNEAIARIAHPGLSVVNVASVAGHQLPALLAPTRRYRYAFRDIERCHADLLRLCNLAPPARRAQLAYMLSKNFVIWYSRAMAATFGAKGARVLSVSPGSFDTAMGQLEDSTGAGALARMGALGRFGKPGEIAELLAFCAGDKPGYLTGCDIICDGGSTAAMTPRKMLKLATGR